KRNQIRDLSIAGLILVDGIFFGIAMLLAYYVRIQSGWFDEWLIQSSHEFSDYAGHFSFGGLLYIALATYRGMYLDTSLFRIRAILPGLLKISVYWFVIYLFISLVFKFDPPISRLYVLGVALFSVPCLLIPRIFYSMALRRSRWGPLLRQKIIIVGYSSELEQLIEFIRLDPQLPYDVAGWIPIVEGENESNFGEVSCLGLLKDLEDVIDSVGPDIIILADMAVGSEKVDFLVNLCGREGIDFKLSNNLFPVFSSGLRVQTISGVPLFGIEELAIEKWYNRILKRSMDIVGAVAGITLSAPFILAFSWLVYRESPGPVFYRQVRSGRWGESFEIIKIRSMHVDAEKDGVGWSTKYDNRRLKIGGFMRKWNIDELPQFWNVLKGEMSLVGPRPERPELIKEFKYQIKLYNIRHGVKPGLTGWAQVNGWRGDTDLSERVRHDLYYMENWSIWTDLQIMLMTMYRFKNAA
ncbi:MAG: sugar transferase, partial [Verrucomicrobiota bacterium]